jgi:hypothetical protein
LCYSVNAINETTGPSGVVPVLLVCGTLSLYKVAGLDTRLQPNTGRFKARYFAQVFADLLKKRSVHNFPNLRHDRYRVILAMAFILGFEKLTFDISMAFLRAKLTNMRDLYMERPRELNLSPEKLLKLVKLLYSDSGDRWHCTLQ